MGKHRTTESIQLGATENGTDHAALRRRTTIADNSGWVHGTADVVWTPQTHHIHHAAHMDTVNRILNNCTDPSDAKNHRFTYAYDEHGVIWVAVMKGMSGRAGTIVGASRMERATLPSDSTK